VTIARDDRESRDPRVSHRVEDFVAFGDLRAPVAATEGGVTRAAPGRRSGREVLWVRSRRECRQRTAPDLPGGARGLQLREEPLLLFRAEHRGGRLVAARVVDVLSAEPDRSRWVAAVVGPASIEDLEGFFRDEVGKLR